MPKEETIRGKVCRFYAKGLIWISKDGTLAAEKDRTHPHISRFLPECRKAGARTQIKIEPFSS